MMVPRALLLLLLVTLMMECVSAKRPKPPKPRRPCKYNKQKYSAGTVIESLPDYCVELKCSVKGKRTELALIEGCTCCKPVTELPIDPPTKPLTQPPKPTTVPPKPTTVPSNPVTEGSSDNDCDYSATFGSTHTMNLAANDACAHHLNKVSASDITLVLETHNTLRAKVAKGDESLGCPGPQPSATNMKELKWNSQLAEVAQAWAEQCPGGHDSGDDRKICDPEYYVGQNIYFYWGYDDADAWAAAINAWYDEVKDMPSTLVDTFGSNTCGTGGVIGHYTQVVWAETYEVGCGAIHYPATLGGNTYPESKIYVCNYGDGGNWLGSPVYEIGATASNCPNGVSADYPELCA